MIQFFLGLSLLLGQSGTFKIIGVGMKTESAEFLLPPTFTSFSLGEPVTMTNFDGDYVHGGILPPNGVEITISTWKKEGTLRDLMLSDMRNKVFTETTIYLSDLSGTKVVTVENSPQIQQKTTIVYAEGKKVFYKIFLIYHTYNREAEAYEAFFKGFLLSIKLLK